MTELLCCSLRCHFYLILRAARANGGLRMLENLPLLSQVPDMPHWFDCIIYIYNYNICIYLYYYCFRHSFLFIQFGKIYSVQYLVILKLFFYYFRLLISKAGCFSRKILNELAQQSRLSCWKSQKSALVRCFPTLSTCSSKGLCNGTGSIQYRFSRCYLI